MEFGGDKWKKKIDRIGKAVVKQMEGRERKEGDGTLGSFRLAHIHPLGESE